MVALYVTSSAGAAGKTTICAGLGKHLLDNGQKVGFFKPIMVDNSPTEGIDNDALFMKQILKLDEPVDRICPVISGQGNLADQVKEACAQVFPAKDVVIVEGVLERSLVEALGARVIIVEDYSREVSEAKFSNGYHDLGKYLLGVVLNKVPGSQLDGVRGELSSRFGAAGLNILGVLPEDRTLFTLSIGELAEHLQGKILNCAEKSVELVENFMLGAMTIDSGLAYFGRKANKAVVVSGRRPDVQMAALETSVRCLILSGNIAPTPTVQHRAEDKKVPIVVVESDTIATVAAIEDALNKTRFNQEKKLPKLTEIMGKRFNFLAVYQGLGLIN